MGICCGCQACPVWVSINLHTHPWNSRMIPCISRISQCTGALQNGRYPNLRQLCDNVEFGKVGYTVTTTLLQCWYNIVATLPKFCHNFGKICNFTMLSPHCYNIENDVIQCSHNIQATLYVCWCPMLKFPQTTAFRQRDKIAWTLCEHCGPTKVPKFTQHCTNIEK